MREFVVLLVAIVLTGCDSFVQEMKPTEYGVKFRVLPVQLAGGLSGEVVPPGQYVFVWPWDRIYRFDVSLQYLSWGREKGKNESQSDEFVYTRALDGNEVALGVTVQYRISSDPKDLLRLVRYVSSDVDGVRKIVQSIARADIRTYMNELKTSEFFNRNARYHAIERARDAMNSRLTPDGIIVEKVILDEHRFERLLGNGTVDRSYQERIDETQKLGQDTERELLRIETVRAQKSQELNETQAKVNRVVAEAQGYLNQAKFRGDSYLQSKKNEADGILATGRAEVEGLAEQIRALSGPGGKAILRLEIARQLMRQKARYVLMSEQPGGLDVRRFDANNLIDQIGLLEGLKTGGLKKQGDDNEKTN